MLFETTLSHILGDVAYQSESSKHSPKARRDLLKKAVRRLIRAIDGIDTSTAHKEILLFHAQDVLRALNGVDAPTWPLFYRLLSLVSALLGFAKCSGEQWWTPQYWQQEPQHESEVRARSGGSHQLRREYKSAISKRREVANRLFEERLSNYEISLVLSISEHAVQKLRAGR